MLSGIQNIILLTMLILFGLISGPVAIVAPPRRGVIKSKNDGIRTCLRCIHSGEQCSWSFSTGLSLLPQRKKTMVGTSSMETTHVEGHMRTHCKRICAAVTISTPSPSGATLPKATKMTCLVFNCRQ